MGLDLGGGHGGGDGAEGFVDRRSAVPHDFKVGGIERVEKELGILAIVGQVRVAFGNAAVFAHHVFAVLKGQAEGGGQGLRGAGGVFAHLVHPIEYAADQAGDDFRVVAIEIVAHGPDVGDKMVGRAGGHHEARAFELVGDVVDVRRPANERVVGSVLDEDFRRGRRVGRPLEVNIARVNPCVNQQRHDQIMAG